MADSQIEMRRWHDWTDPDFFMEGRQRERRLLPLFLRQILPRQMQQTKLTLTGWMLIVVAMGIGSAAYNTSSNILFMTLSLLLSSLVLSGILSLVNFRKLSWSLKVPEHLQVGEVGMAEVALANRKRIFPSMNIVFRVSSTALAVESPLYLKHAVSAGESASLEWTFVPEKRGPFSVHLYGVESKFPFGFLLKGITDLVEEIVWVWPTRVDYTFKPLVDGRRHQTGVSRRQAGAGSDLLNVRRYEHGDPPRLIHWKATARMNKLMIRQLAQEGESGFHLRLDPFMGDWTEAQIETLCSVACGLAEDLFHSGRLETVSVGQAEVIAIRGLRELHEFFDQLARLEQLMGPLAELPDLGQGRRNLITFKPCGESGVTIHVNGEQAGQA
ncbi:DUF58 domain-containing protein [Coraliomargarita sp. W4R53]